MKTMQFFWLISSVHILSCTGFDGNEMKIFRSIKGLNFLANDLVSSEDGGKEMGKRLASSMTVVSEWEKASRDLGQLNEVAAIAVVKNPTVENAANLKKISSNYKNIHLHETKLSASNVVDALKKLHYRLGDFQIAQTVGDPAFQSTDEEFSEFNQKLENVAAAANHLEKSFMRLGYAAGSNEYQLAGEILSLTHSLDVEALKFEETIENAKEMLEANLDTFAWDLSEEVTELQTSVDRISRDLRAGVSSILLGQIEADTKPARECHRTLMELINTGGKRKQNLGLLLSGPSNISVREERQKVLQKRLEDPEKGVESCLRKLRSVYDPAPGPPTNPRDIFFKVKERFFLEFKKTSSWKETKALNELQRFELMARQMLLQLSSLLVLQYVTLVAGGQPKAVEESIRAYKRFNGGIKLIKETYFKNFPNCQPSTAMKEAVSSRRLLCQGPPTRKTATNIDANKETKIERQESELQEQKAAIGKRGANAFSVYLYGQHITTDPVFDKAYYNSPGGFDTSTQEFLAPEDGLYFFSLTMSRRQNDHASWKLSLLDATGKEKEERRVYYHPNDNLTESFNTVTVIWRMKKGEKVKVKNVGPPLGGKAWCDINIPCVLTGFRLR